MLEIVKISTYYGYVQALKEVSIEVRDGEIVSIIGANGAGKSTLLNSISAIVPPRSGQILLDGKDITRLPVEAIVGMGISQVPERRQIFSTSRYTTTCSWALTCACAKARNERCPTIWNMCLIFSRSCGNAGDNLPGRFPGASSKWWLSAGV